MVNARDLLPPRLRALLHASITPLQLAIADALLRHSCVPGKGKGPNLGTNSTASDNCRVCLGSLFGQLTLRHKIKHPVDGGGSRATRECDRTYHFSCLIEWAEVTIKQQLPVTCPGDRQHLIPRDISVDISRRFNLRTMKQHDVRHVDSVVPFWQTINRDNIDAPSCRFTIMWNDPSCLLRLATLKFDVGFVTSDLVDMLPLDDQARREFNRYDSERDVVPGRDLRGRRRYKYVYDHYAYVNNTLSPEDGEDTWDFLLCPMERNEFLALRRYLLGVMGEIWVIDLHDDEIRARRATLSNEAVVNLDAEIKVRNLMLQDCAIANVPDTVSYFWPFPNGGGGITMGRPIVDERYPTRRYIIDDLNLGQEIRARYGYFVATQPRHPSIQEAARLVDDYLKANLPDTFPENQGLEGEVVYVLGARDPDEGPIIQKIDLPEDWSPAVTREGSSLHRQDQPPPRNGLYDRPVNDFARTPLQPQAQAWNIPQPFVGWDVPSALAQARSPHPFNNMTQEYGNAHPFSNMSQVPGNAHPFSNMSQARSPHPFNNMSQAPGNVHPFSNMSQARSPHPFNNMSQAPGNVHPFSNMSYGPGNAHPFSNMSHAPGNPHPFNNMSQASQEAIGLGTSFGGFSLHRPASNPFQPTQQQSPQNSVEYHGNRSQHAQQYARDPSSSPDNIT